MMLGEVVRECEVAGVAMENSEIMKREVTGVAYDSRKVKGGYLFVAIKGEKHDGHDFIRDAIKNGAVAIAYESNNTEKVLVEEAIKLKRQPLVIPIQINNSRKTLACTANNFYGRPSENLMLIGVTGTNGKTTTTYILKSILDILGKGVGLIGTIHYIIKEKIVPAYHTTPEAVEFQSLLKEMLESSCTHVISEVSSHALSQYRVHSTVFRVAVFTNLTRDHLDFHMTMNNYFEAKKRLFTELLHKNGTAIINIDDEYGKRLYSELYMHHLHRRNILTYGIETEADIRSEDINNSIEGLRFKISFGKKKYDILSSLTGIPNVYNLMSAAGAALAAGAPWEAILEGIKKEKGVKGRFERIDIGQNFVCFVDYAHTEDALERLIKTARELSLSLHLSPDRLARIITVFGCGGDRDRGKRPKMAEVATRYSDLVIITSDNPRSEEPLKIIKDIEEGVVESNYLIEPDRKKAIRKAIEMAGEGDIVLIAGKGHEDYQEIKGVRYRFSDREVAEEAIRERLRVQKRNA